LKAVWAITPKPMLLRWRILMEDELPAGALGHVAADQQDPEAEDRAKAEGQAPAEVGGEPVGVEQDQGQGGPEHRAEPERAVGHQVDPTPQPAGISSSIAAYSPPIPAPVKKRQA
jgi:hypothetical protein